MKVTVAAKQSDFVTVVSGLPRSGTSMMMRMVDQGGIPVLSDGFRTADEDNPYGYYEYEPVKQLGKETSWVSEACGKVVKVIYIFLYHLPKDYSYKVLFMKRNLDEVVASQKVMLRRRQEGDRLTDQQLIDSYSEQLRKLDLWIRQQPNFNIHYLDYHEVVADPAKAAVEITRFLGLPLDIAAMTNSVDPTLYRNRSIAI